MRSSWIKTIFNSVFMKLLLVLVVAGICINLSVTSYIRHEHETNEPAIRNSVINHLNYIIKDLGDPPDFERAKRVAQEASIQIEYQSPSLNWSTSESVPLSPQLKLRPSRTYPRVLIGENRGRHIFVIDQGSGRLIFQLGHEFNWDTVDMEAVGRLMALLTAILAGAYLFIRWILNPVKALTEGVREVSRGNLDHRVRLRRSDELGELAKMFNAMTDRIRNMLRAKEQLLLDVSHELRSPLTRMKVALESLSESYAKKNIREDVAEMEKMVTEILKTARSHYTHGQLNLQRIDMVDLIKGVVSAFKGQLPDIRMGEMPDHIELDMDPVRVKTVLKNVLDNAVKYSFNSSKPVEISMENCNPYWMVRIRDNGVGIPEDELPYIFEPFYRVDKSRSKDTGGYGLGLSLCKTVMEAHQGKIEVESSPEGGTTVSLYFLLNHHEEP
ncbi:MAG TPA: HAMP domain-containing sensor histidine kinase [Nitrospiria bacterium]|nr:HAMP domain-containing sensor histidine kinase [Nitrospiria bacterium]